MEAEAQSRRANRDKGNQMKTKWIEPTIEQRDVDYKAERAKEVPFLHLVKKVPRLPGQTLTQYVRQLKAFASWGH